MVYKTVFTAVVLSLLAFLNTPEATAQAAGQAHTVQQGETLFSISRTYDVTVGDLRRWNRLQSDALNQGQELLVGPPRNDSSVIHTVESGQTLFAISRLYEVRIAEIQSWNNLEGTQLNEGQELTIFQTQPADGGAEIEPPSAKTEQSKPRESIIRDREDARGTTYYTVRSGDTLTRIAREHDMTVDQLSQLNNLQSDMLSIGQRLTVRDVQTAPSIAGSAEESTPQGKFVSYRLESGESVENLKDRFLMSEDELSALNPDLNIETLRPGQQVTVLLPPSRKFSNPFRKGASLENLGEIPVTRYSDSERANPTTSGELYNPDYLTAGHSNMPLGNVIYIENPETGQGVYVRINDRTSGSGIKLSHKAFDMLGFSNIQRSSVIVYLDQ
jgi:LysM repeat protein